MATDSRARSGRDPLIGTRLGNFLVETKIAEGGMGLIYGAQHTVIGRKAAIKVLTEKYSNDLNMVKRLHREARAVNRIGHPSIVDIFDFGRTPDDREYFVMEFLEGESLGELLERRGALPWSTSEQLLTQVLDALAAAHELDIVHRDIKPENIIVTGGETPDSPVGAKVLDFGIAKSVGLGPEGERLTRAGSVMGTPEYIAPEQIRGRPVDGRADLYSVGIILFELITGRRPYDSDKVINLLMSHLRDPIPSPGRLDPALGIPAHVAAVLPKALAKKPEDRFQSAREFANALGLQIRSVSAEDGTRPLPDMFWETGGAQATAPGAEPTAPQPELAGRGVAARPSTAIPGTRSGPAVGEAAAAPRGGALRWAIPLLILVLSGAAIGAYFLLGRHHAQSTDQAGKKAHGRQAATAKAAASNAVAFPPVKDPQKLLYLVRRTLREGLDNPDPPIRVSAVRGLGELRDAEARKRLEKQLRTDPDGKVRAAVASALAKLGKSDVIGALKKAAEEATPATRVPIHAALASLGDEQATKDLVAALGAKRRSVRLAAALQLAQLSDPRAKPVLEKRLRAAARRGELIGLTPVIAALARLGHEKALGTLKKGLDQPDRAVRLRYATALAQLGHESALPTLKSLLSKGPMPSRLQAARSLAQLGDYSGMKVIKRGIVAKSASTRVLAAMALGSIADRTALAPLARALEDDSALVRSAAAESAARIFGQMPSALVRRSQSWLLTALESGDWSARRAAVGIGAEMDPELAVELLGWAFRDKDARVRAAAVARLGQMRKPSPKALRIIKAALGDKSPAVRATAAAALGQSGDRQAKPLLARVVYDRSKRVGMVAAGQLLALGDTRHLKPLLKAARHRDATVRAHAYEALSNWRNKRATKLLRKALRDRSERVRLVAALSLARRGDRKGVRVLQREIKRDGGRADEAMRALVRLDRAPRKRVRAWARAKSPTARAAAMESAAKIGMIDVLALGSRDRTVRVRRSAARGLARRAKRDRRSVVLLRRLTRDPDPAVRAAAALGLARAGAASTHSKIDVEPIKKAPVPAEPKLPEKPSGHKANQAVTFAPDPLKVFKNLLFAAELQINAGKYERALRTLGRARRLRKTAPTLFDIGYAHLKIAIRDHRNKTLRKRTLHHLGAARRLFKRYLSAAPSGPQAHKARKGLRDTSRLVEAVRR